MIGRSCPFTQAHNPLLLMFTGSLVSSNGANKSSARPYTLIIDMCFGADWPMSGSPKGSDECPLPFRNHRASCERHLSNPSLGHPGQELPLVSKCAFDQSWVVASSHLWNDYCLPVSPRYYHQDYRFLMPLFLP